MTETFQPENQAQLRDLIGWANAGKSSLELVGQGTKRGLGEPVGADNKVNLSAIAGIVAYEPEELVITLHPGTPLSEVEAALSDHDQMLIFEPQDWGYVLDGISAKGTIGGAVMVSSNGPRRFKAGAVRDHLLGFSAVSGRGEEFRAGGKVVKNVTGYDLSKLMTGSYGTLAALTEMTLKVLPAPAKTYTLLVYGLDTEPAMRLLRSVAGSAYEASGLAYLPAKVAMQSIVDYVAGRAQSVVAIRVEGPDISVRHRIEALRQFVTGALETEELHTHNSLILWQEIRDVRMFPTSGGSLWRVSIPPTEAPSIVSACQPDHWMADWAGGVLWMQFGHVPDDQGAFVRSSIRHGGQATLIRGPEQLRAATSAFQPLEPVLAGLNQRVKENYDPNNILNPGRLFASNGSEAG
jgi:glycolate oxidase FAD binding subunit